MNGIVKSDVELGMDRQISRRDFLDGVAVAALASAARTRAVGSSAVFAPEQDPGYYPPELTGMRGSGYPSAYTTGHEMRDGKLPLSVATPEDTGEVFDLVVVGGGISGLAAAYFFQKQNGYSKKVLVLDNHDDFGGHAKRNEFRSGSDLRISNAGSFDLGPGRTAAQRELFDDIGIDVDQLAKHNVNTRFYSLLGMGQAIFFDEQTFGRDKLVKNPAPWTDFTYLYSPNPPADAEGLWKEFMWEAPLSEPVKEDIYRLYHEDKDYLPGLNRKEKSEKLNYMSYSDFLIQVAGCDPMVCTFMRDRTFGDGRGIDSTPALLAHQRFNLPGFAGMNLDEGQPVIEEATYHFPEGNATVARLLARKLIPHALPGHTVADCMTARVNYSALDQVGQETRIRLNSTAVKAENTEDAYGMTGVRVTYSRGERMHSVRAKSCVMACWNFVIPYLCPEMLSWQKDALAYGVHTPNLWVNVWLRNWKAFHKAGVNFINAPNSYFAQIILEQPVSIGEYKHSQSPDDPIVLTMLRGYIRPELHIKDQFRQGRAEMYATTFETFERNTRDLLGRALGPFGFDPANDILGLTVNRWGHGYSYWYSPLYDEFLKTGGEPPHLRARQPFGNITIANTDCCWHLWGWVGDRYGPSCCK